MIRKKMSWWNNLLHDLRFMWRKRIDCNKGGYRHQYPLRWEKTTKKHMAKDQNNPAREIMWASGFGMIARWIGVCPRCNDSVEWSSENPNAPVQAARR